MTTSGDIFRLGILGLGKIAQTHHLPIAAESPRVELAAVCDLSADLSKEVGERFNVPIRLTELDDLIAVGLDAAMVCNRDHANVVARLLDAGVAVFVEKPLCWSRAQAEFIAVTAARTRTPLMVGYMKRHDPAVIAARAWLDGQGAQFVHVLHRAGGRHRVDRPYDLLKSGRADFHAAAEMRAVRDAIASEIGDDDPQRIGLYFSVLELLSHDFDVLRQLLGSTSFVRGSLRVTDTSTGSIFQFGLRADGVPISFDCVPSFNSPRTWDEEISVYAPDSSLRIKFPSPFLREGSSTLELWSADSSREVASRSTFGHRSAFSRQFDAFIDVVRNGLFDPSEIEFAVRDLTVVRDVVRAL